MSISVQSRYGKFQLRVKHKLLPKPYFDTFPLEEEASTFGRQLHDLLDAGIVPAELNTAEKRTDNPPLWRVIDNYLAESTIAPSDRPTITLVKELEGNTKLLDVTHDWADDWVSRMKVVNNLAPSTLKKRVESLSRCLEWYWRKKPNRPANTLKMLPKGYSAPTAAEAQALKKAGLEQKVDVQRNRRLDADEIARIRAALAGKQSKDKQRPLPNDPDFALLFEIILETGMRLSEAYTLRVNQIDFKEWVINVDGSKGHRGKLKPRLVAIRPALDKPLKAWCRDRVGLMFDFWDGTPEDKAKCTSRLSARFRTLFAYAGVDDFSEHDLRHEATCTWVQMRDPQGSWTYSETEICKMMGWTDNRMMLRYASLRGSDLSSRMRR